MFVYLVNQTDRYYNVHQHWKAPMQHLVYVVTGYDVNSLLVILWTA